MNTTKPNKLFLLTFLFTLLLSSKGVAAGGFETQFSAPDFFIVILASALLGITLWGLNMVLSGLQRKLSALKEQEELNAVEITKTETVIDDTDQAKTVLLYCGLLFVFFYLCYALVRGTNLESHVIEWMNLIVRWMHVVFGIAWIGASFYFVFLENALNRTENLRPELAGNLWAVHGGGFYYLEKYKVAPEVLPKDLHWFKYEAYFTWLSGFTLLVIVYYLGADVYLIDPEVMKLTSAEAIGIGIGTLVVSWLVYDFLCKTPLVDRVLLFAFILLLFTSGVAWFLSQVFSSRAAYIHVGAMLGTLMAANVFRVIIPGQKAMVNAAKAGKQVDPSYGKKALRRSLHNNYFTLPVIFIMISNHFPSTYGSAFNWIVLVGLTVASVLIKHYLNLKEQGQKSIWILPAGIAMMIGLALFTAPKTKSVCKEDAPATIKEVNEIIQKRCATCHSATPTDDVIKAAPNNITFDDAASIVKLAERINQRAVITKTMPQANKTGITQAERDVLQCWIENGAKGN